ncbi:hypothetical protein T05_375 [Trichinella murrelli]|uniref:Uncharacterized protein n=1 Tax=Trichinella murrelli TaxID=144512 RepID=A0A0V0UC45_9BILA|nr:hypothetical protein T05_375 [Trichinella murrelli]
MKMQSEQKNLGRLQLSEMLNSKRSTTGRWKMVDFEINIQPFSPLYLFHLCLLGVGVMRKKY